MNQLNAPPSPTNKIHYVSDIHKLARLSPEERTRLEQVAKRYAFRANDYYLSLINWDDPNDPIRRLIVPRMDELEDWGSLDASNEAANTVLPGVQHKYARTVLLLCSEVCGGYCRYCFRKRLFIHENREATSNVSEGIRYIAQHPEVTNVLLTGGDPLLLSTDRLAKILAALRAIPHVRIIRIGSKMPAFNPWRILNDSALLEILSRYSEPRRRIYLMAHFDHVRELTDPAVEAIDACIRAGVICVNQCPIIRGVNDDPVVLGDLFRQLSFIGCPPYYCFQGRPTAGNRPYCVPIVRGWEIFQKALRRGSGLARRPRFIMSHATGKIEIAGVDHRYIYLRYQCAKDPNEQGSLKIFKRDDKACWLDDLTPVSDLGLDDSRVYPALLSTPSEGAPGTSLEPTEDLSDR
ncbi:MAG TPA: KamA family radical SAM protein [Phycisphaerae bacterium]|nr:KamA family radical SAM protein [Phycisphaerae bacterium]HOB74350.1 KamA family radical SAM protein [Phycisphaerae bacterium]HOJ56688.1 KamA family radical SAM protein [Phycisphaerae bacterium]HOL26560.1 KamA family radical SAM protein [Phycisphaerae bacterium]HPP22930.1 KamA family radical SAM protein [Phycisphaerae bacterium]